MRFFRQDLQANACAFRCLLLSVLFPLTTTFAFGAGVPNSPEGFSEQYQEVFKAWQEGDSQKLKSSLDGFAIPSGWFIEAFGSDQGEMLASQYADEFADFETHVARNFLMYKNLAATHYGAKQRNLSVETNLKPSTYAPTPAPNPPPLSLTPLPEVERFETGTFVLIHQKKQRISAWMDSFFYVDGEFRYLGRGNYAFWDNVRIRRADPCAKPGEQTGGKLVKRVEPIYPQETEHSHAGESVGAVLTVGKDGLVTKVDILRGDPALVDAAEQAFLQWQYTPFMNCGQPVEMSSAEHVKLPPSQTPPQ